MMYLNKGNLYLLILFSTCCCVLSVCPSSWSEHNGLCYFFSSQNYRFSDAIVMCDQRNASLLKYRDDSDWSFVSGQVAKGTRTQYWLGLRVINNTWSWLDGSHYNKSQVHWYQNKEAVTNRRNYECAAFRSYKPYTGQLLYQNCFAGQRIVCQKPNDAYEFCDSSDGWELVNNACYKFYDTPTTWFDARTTCQRDGGDLYLPTTYRMVNSIGDLIACRTTADKAWIGISDTNWPGQFRSATNQTLKYAAFYSYGKTIIQRGGTCVFANPLANFYWESDLCTTNRKFICEKPAGVCQPGWTKYADNCYQLVDTTSYQATWFLAKQFCANENTQLLTIQDAGENQFIASILQNQQISKIWLGFSDEVQDNTLAWLDGSPLSGNYSNWYVGYPKPIANRTDCGALLMGNVRSAWIHDYCFKVNAFICKAKVITKINSNTSNVNVVTHCDKDWVHFRTKCYKFGISSNSSGYSWTKARHQCILNGADLVTITDPYEQSFIQENQLAISTAWIGLKYNVEYKRLMWIDQSKVTFSNFYPGEPDDLNNGQQCIKIVGGRLDYMGAWDDGNCSSKLDFICRKAALSGGPSATPAPTTIGSWSYRCGPGWIFNSMTDTCYQVVLGRPMTWTDAQWDCQRRGGSLLSIEGPREQSFVQAILNTGTYAKIQFNFWMGGSDRSVEGGWEWSDRNIPFAYLNWHPGEPNEYGVGEDCMEIVPRWRYQWNDKRCDHEQQYICKKPATPLSTTAGAPTEPTLQSCQPQPLISGNYSILDDTALTASSKVDSTHSPFASRIFTSSTGGWSAATTTLGEYIQVTFYDLVIVKSITTLGRSDADEYVKQYQIRYQYDQFSTWTLYEDPPGTTKTFNGNTDVLTPVTNNVTFPFEARSIRLYPTSWHNKISLRWELQGCMETSCRPDFGVSGPLFVPDTAITVSTKSDAYHGGSAARYQSPNINSSPKGWEALVDDSNQWIKVDLGNTMIIRGISTKGSPSKQEWVSSYKVAYSTGSIDHYYQEPYGHILNIPGNTDNIHAATYFFKAHFKARYIKIIPTTFHTSIALRFDVLVCQQGCNSETLINGANKIADDSLTASSVRDNGHNPSRSRLYQPAQGNSAGAWRPRFDDSHQYIQVDLSARVQVVAVATQGRQDRPEWVTSYTLSYSQDGVKWFPYDAFTRTPIVFPGNFDQNTVRKQYISIPFIARYVRLWPKTYHTHIALRWEIYGCPGADSGTRIGCYADDVSSRDLSYEPFTNPALGMWPPMCVHHCFEKGYYYAGLQAQYKCFCGNSYGRYGPLPLSKCNLPCFPLTRFKCGGTTSNMVYSTGLTASYKVCKPNWKEYAGSCYLLLLDRRSWGDARAECQKQGADLVTINSQAEQDLIYSVISNGGGQDVWIGLNDMREENLFEWIRGERVRFTNWNVNQPRHPSNSEEDCIMINPKTGGWQDENCDTKHQYVCQADKQTSSQPSTQRVDQGCQKGWEAYRSSCYLYIDITRTFMDAYTVCRDSRATLVQIDDKFEQAYLSSVLGTKTGSYWTDVSDLKLAGQYNNYGSSYPYLLYTNWGGQQPSGNGSRCVVMNTGKAAGFWSDIPCGQKSRAVCESHRAGYMQPTKPSITTATTPCATGWIDVNGFCYQMNAVPRNRRLMFSEAVKNCNDQGATLASFHSKSDLVQLQVASITNRTSSSDSSYDTNYWIGLDDLQGVYRWHDSSPLDLTNWSPGQPDNYQGRENCAELLRSTWKWNDANCYNRRNWICKIPKGRKVTIISTMRAPTAGSGVACGNDLNWMMYNGNCYYIVDGVGTQSKSWREARSWCQTHSADLVSITSMFEQLFIQNQIKNTTAFSFWTGFSETDFDLGYKWSDGSPASFINWNKGEPNDFFGPEDCVEIMVYTGKWNDAHCANKKGFICEKSLAAKPATTPASVLPGNCPAGFSGYGNKCFKLVVNQPKTWNAASAACRALGRDKYYLASINNALENAFITSILSDMSTTPWIGLRRGPSSVYRWVDNEDLVYTNWYHGEPNGDSNSQMCTRVYSYEHSAGEWDDVLCNQTNAYICETKKKAYITTPPIVPNPCDAKQGFKPYGNDCLLYVSAPKTWSQANAYCHTKGAYLATVGGVFEQAYLFLTINDRSIVTKTSTWIGLKSNNGTYSWANPIWPVAYTNWLNGEPSHKPGENCISMGTNGKWSDDLCSLTKPYVCQITTAFPPVSPPPPNSQCPDSSWVLNGTKCYMFRLKTPVSYLDASIDCQRHRANVVSIHSKRENDFLMKTGRAYTTQSEGFWTSLHKSPQAGFEWFDGSPKNFINWDQGEPSGKSQRGDQENCVEVRAWNGKWNDLDCTQQRGYICERNPAIDTNINTMPRSTPVNAPSTRFVSPTTIKQITPTFKPTKGPTAAPTAKPILIPTIPNYTGHTAERTGTQSKGSSSTLSGGMLAGIMVAVVVIAIGGVVAMVMIKRRRNTAGTPSLSFDNSTYDVNNGKVEFSNTNGTNNIAKFMDNEAES